MQFSTGNSQGQHEHVADNTLEYSAIGCINFRLAVGEGIKLYLNLLESISRFDPQAFDMLFFLLYIKITPMHTLIGGTVVQWIALMPYSKKVLGSIHRFIFYVILRQ